MNGYELMSSSYKKLMDEGAIEKRVAEKAIRIYDFLAKCDIDDICQMVDSSAFNEIIRGFLYLAADRAEISESDRSKLIKQLYWIFDEFQAKKVLDRYLEG